MRFTFTKHALGKFKTHKLAGWKFLQRDINEAIKNPYFAGVEEKRGVKFVLRSWDKDHDLRVIYKQENDIITVITFYPTEKGRYLT